MLFVLLLQGRAFRLSYERRRRGGGGRGGVPRHLWEGGGFATDINEGENNKTCVTFLRFFAFKYVKSFFYNLTVEEQFILRDLSFNVFW